MRRFAPAARFAAQTAVLVGGTFLAFLAFLPISSAAPTSEDPTSNTTKAFRPDQIVLKLSDDRAESLDLGDASELSAVLLRHGAISQRRAFGGFGNSHAPTATAEQRAERARKRFTRRAARAPRIREVPDLENIFVVQLAGSTDILQAVAELTQQPGVVYAEPNFLYHTMETPLPDEPYIPNDRYLSEEGLHFSEGAWGQTHLDLWGIERIRAIEGWNQFDLDGSGDFDASEIRPGEHVVVAVIDSGIDSDHPEIAANLWRNPGEIPDNAIDDDGNGLVDDIIGWDFVDDDGSPRDLVGHGTHVAGTIAARGDNELGIIGVAPWAKIMTIRGLDDTGSGDEVGLANSVRYAADMGADIISASWGGFTTSRALADAFRYARDVGVLSVAAAGNSDTEVASVFPANLDVVLAVAATDPDDVRATFSNFGSMIDLSAPGVAILSLNANGGANAIAEAFPDRVVATDYLQISGTSMACPHVSGTAAVLLSQDSNRTLDDLRGHLMAGAESIAESNPGFEMTLGHGRIDMFESLVIEPQPVIELTRVDQGKAMAGRDSSIVVFLRNRWTATSNFTATLTTESPYAIIRKNQTEFAPLPTGQRANNRSDPFEASFDASTPIGAEILFDLTLEASDGYRKVLPFTVSITHFADVSRQTGLPTFDFLPWRVTLHDYDGDGDVDAQLIGLFSNNLYENSGGSFTAQGGWGGIGTSQGLFLDTDNDGDQDLFMAGFNLTSGSQFLLNTGGGNFSDITDSSGIRGLRAFATAALDYDGDGWVDFVSGANRTTLADHPSGVSLMRNNGDNTFTDVSEQTCLDPATDLLNGQIFVFDFDDDADSDLLFAASRSGIILYQNNGDGTFSDVTVKAGLTPFGRNKEGCRAASAHAQRPECASTDSMGGAVGDYDNDGHIDVFLTSRNAEDFALLSTLYRNDGLGGFIDVTAESGDLAVDDISGIHWGNAFFDFDNDGDLDLYVTSENITGINTNSLYENNGDRTFTRVTDLAFPSTTGPSGATAAIGDYNNDGALDIYAPSGILGSGGSGAFYENLTGQEKHWIVVRLRGTISHRDAYGARVTVRAAGRTQLRELNTSPVDPQPLHFGLGTAPSVDEIRVRWPSGVVQTLHGAAVNRVIEIAEPAECVVATDYPEPGQSILECPVPKSVKQEVRRARLPDRPVCRP